MTNEFDYVESLGAFWDKEGRLHWPREEVILPPICSSCFQPSHGLFPCAIAVNKRKKERRETEMSNYEKSAEVAGKLLQHLEGASCRTPSVTLFDDGSGYFEISEKDAAAAREVFSSYLPGVFLYESPGQNSSEIHFEFETPILEQYASVCGTCKRPLEGK